MAAENITELKEYLKKAYDLESTIYSYEQIRQHMQERRNKVHKDWEETLYVRKYEYGDIIPYYYEYAQGGYGMTYYHYRGLGPLKQPGPSGSRWGDCAPDGYPGKKHMSDYKILEDRILVKRTPEELEEVKVNRKKEIEKQDAFNKSILGFLSRAAIGVACGAFFSAIAGGVIALLTDMQFLTVFKTGTAGLTIFLVLAPFLFSGAGNKPEKPKPEPRSRTYLEQKAAYESIVDARNAELARAHGELDYCTMTEQEITPYEARARKELKEHYASNLIHPKYQNFLAVSQIYDYIDTGRCDKLEGPDGAYNIFEFELRMNTIISDLRVIQQKLDEVISLQHSICAALHSLNSTLGAISSQLDSIQGSINANTMAINDFNASVCHKLNWI